MTQRPSLQAAEAADGQRDFDFIFGDWTVHNRRRINPLAGLDEWVEFEGTSTARPIWGGAANLEEYHAVAPTGPIDGLTLRVYNPSSRQWSLLWANRTRGAFDKPMVGEFRNGRGEFYDQEDFNGRAIFVRYVWSGISPASCRWEQAFSTDGGKTWEPNWVMQFARKQ